MVVSIFVIPLYRLLSFLAKARVFTPYIFVINIFANSTDFCVFVMEYLHLSHAIYCVIIMSQAYIQTRMGL